MATDTNSTATLAASIEQLDELQRGELEEWLTAHIRANGNMSLEDTEAELWNELDKMGFRHACDLTTEKPALTAILWHMQEGLEKSIETATAIGSLVSESPSELNYRAMEAQLEALETAACWVRVLDKLRRVLAARVTAGAPLDA